jgi:hypothetical protein
VRRMVLTLVLLAAGGAAACSGGHAGGTVLPSTSSTGGSSASARATPAPTGPFGTQYATDPRSPITWLVKPTGDATTDEVLAAYRHWVYVVVLAFADPNPDDPAFLSMTSGQARKDLSAALKEAQKENGAQLGPTIVASAAARRTGLVAVVVACQDLTANYDYTDGKPAAKANGFYKETAVLRKVGGDWVVDRVSGPQSEHHC